MRVRGLKFLASAISSPSCQSHPMRVRGLKFFDPKTGDLMRLVAPHAGAWIEMRLYVIFISIFLVAPHAGAWIEI